MCHERGTLEHILSSCSKALGEGRYHWCHDQVMKVGVHLQHHRSCQTSLTSKTRHHIHKSRRTPKLQTRAQAGLLGTAHDWQMMGGRGKQLRYLKDIVETTLRPDIVAGKSLCKAYNLVGITGTHKRQPITRASEAAEKASQWLWIRRYKPRLKAAWTQASRVARMRGSELERSEIPYDPCYYH